MQGTVSNAARAFFLAFFLLGAAAGPGAAQPAGFLYEVEALDKKEISKLSDEQLLDHYVDTMVEIEASSAFHKAAGFNPREYRSFKKLLRFRVDLLQEITKRKLELPRIQP